VKVIAEGRDALLKRANAVDATLAAHDKRITTVEIKLLKRR